MSGNLDLTQTLCKAVGAVAAASGKKIPVIERFVQLMDGADAANYADGFATVAPQYSTTVGADLMREAVERAQSQQRSKDAFQRILARRQYAPSITEAQLRAAREEGRP